MTKMRSSSGVFARRGDPWVTEREAIRDFGRSPRFEDPDMDQFTKASKAKPRFEMGVNGKGKVGKFAKQSPDTERRKASILRKMNIALAKNKAKVREDKSISLRERSIACPVCKMGFGMPHKNSCKARDNGHEIVGQ